MEKKINNFLFFVSLFILYTIYSSVLILLLKQVGFDITKLNVHTRNTYLILVDISLMIITYLIYRKDNNHDIKKYFRHFGKYFFFGFKMWILGLVLMVISNLLIQHFYPLANTVNENAVRKALIASPIYTTFSACIFAPFMEEMIFRKSLRKVFDNDWIFIIISGLLFGLVHNITVLGKPDMIYIIPYALFGGIFAYTYVKTNDIFVPMTFHLIHNTVLVMAALYNTGVILS